MNYLLLRQPPTMEPTMMSTIPAMMEIIIIRFCKIEITPFYRDLARKLFTI